MEQQQHQILEVRGASEANSAGHLVVKGSGWEIGVTGGSGESEATGTMTRTAIERMMETEKRRLQGKRERER